MGTTMYIFTIDLIIFIIIFSFILEDFLIRKLCIKEKEIFNSEIFYFAEVFLFKRIYHVTVVNCCINGENTKVVIGKSKNDKIGKQIELYTDGIVAVRKKREIEEDFSIGMAILISIVFFILLKYIILHFSELILKIVLIECGIGMLFLVAFPYYLYMSQEEIRKKVLQHY